MVEATKGPRNDESTAAKSATGSPRASRGGSLAHRLFRVLVLVLVLGVLPFFAYTSIYRASRQTTLETRYATELANVGNAFGQYVNNAPRLIEQLIVQGKESFGDCQADKEHSTPKCIAKAGTKRTCGAIKCVLAELQDLDTAERKYLSIKDLQADLLDRRVNVETEINQLNEQLIAANRELAKNNSTRGAGTVLFAGPSRDAATKAHQGLIDALAKTLTKKRDRFYEMSKREGEYYELQAQFESSIDISRTASLDSRLEEIRAGLKSNLDAALKGYRNRRELANAYHDLDIEIEESDPGLICPESPSYRLHRRGGKAQLEITVCPVDELKNQAARMGAHFHLNLESLLQASVQSASLDGVLLVNGENSVIAQRSELLPEMAAFSTLEKPSKAARNAEEKPAVISWLASLGLASQASLDRKRFEWGGQKFFVFEDSVLVEIAIDGARTGGDDDTKTASSTSWKLVGLVDVDRFQRETSAIPLPMLALVILAAGMLVLLIPILRLALLKATDALGQAEAGTLYASFVLFLAIGTVGILHITVDRSLATQLDLAIQQARIDLSERFDHDLKQILKAAKQEDYEGSKAIGPAEDRFEFVGDASADCKDVGTPNRLPDSSPYHITFLTDLEGKPTHQKSNLCQPAMSVPNLFTRDYVRRVVDGNLWVDASANRYFIERIISWRDGSRETAISMPHYAKGESMAGAPDAVQIVYSRLPRLANAELGAGLGFAVVDSKTGKVQFHSNDNLSLVENFFAESAGNRRVRGAIKERQIALDSGTYHGEPHRFSIAPLGSTPWVLVVFGEEEYRNAMLFEALVLTMLHLGLYVSVAVIILATGGAFQPDARWTWLWPDPKLSGFYGRAIPFLASAAVLGVVIGWLEPPLPGGLSSPGFLAGGSAEGSAIPEALTIWLSSVIAVVRAFTAGFFPPVLLAFVVLVYAEGRELAAHRTVKPASIVDLGKGRDVEFFREAISRALAPTGRRSRAMAIAGCLALITMMVLYTVAVWSSRPGVKAGAESSYTAVWVPPVLAVVFFAFLWTLYRMLGPQSRESPISRVPIASLYSWLPFAGRSWLDWRRRYVVASALLLSVASLPPAFHVYFDAFEVQAERSFRLSQALIARNLSERAAVEQIFAQRLVETGGRSLNSLSAAYCENPPKDLLEWRCDSALVDVLGHGVDLQVGTRGIEGALSLSTSLRHMLARSYTAYFARLLPPFNSASEQMGSYQFSRKQTPTVASRVAGFGNAPTNAGTSLALVDPAHLSNPVPDRALAGSAAIMLAFLGIPFLAATGWLVGRSFGLWVPAMDWLGLPPSRWLLVGSARARVVELESFCAQRSIAIERVSSEKLADFRLAARTDILVIEIERNDDAPIVSRFASSHDDFSPRIVALAQDGFPSALLSDFTTSRQSVRFRLMVRPSADAIARMGKSYGCDWRVLRFSDEKATSDGGFDLGDGSEPLLILNWDDWMLEATRRNALLRTLEEVVLEESELDGDFTVRSVLVTSRRPPSAVLEHGFEEGEGVSRHPISIEEKLRWERIFEQFETHAAFASSLVQDGVRPKTGHDQIELERRSWPELHDVHSRIEFELDADQNSHDGPEIVAQSIADLVGSFYQTHWAGCTADEQIILHQLAMGSQLNAKDIELIRGLIKRGLIIRAPDFQPASRSFEIFLQHRDRKRTVEILTAREGAQQSPWRSARAPVLGLIAVATIFIFQSGGDAARSGLALLTGGAATLPALLEMLGFGGQAGRDKG